jgi:crotonobetainyl-CoA:carnitine CoA-transferase CaiB-like acyl-CoA transferase
VRAPAPRESESADSLPLVGLRVIDATAWWAGPSATHALACLGADVIHVESTARIDGARTVGGMFGGKYENWWEASHLFLAVNANKRGVTLDLSSEQGQELLLDLLADADVLVENFSPRVMDGFGVTWEAVRKRNPRCIMLRMPAFGLDGPWRDAVGFAQTMEQLSGLAWLTGHPEDQPRIQRGPCDPLAGMHATFALLVALFERDHSGHGHFVECAMVEGALNVTAEQVIEFTAYGNEMQRLGNRGYEAAPQGLYACAEHQTMENPRWLALSVATDEQWLALLSWAGNPAWASGLAASDLAARRAAHEAIDAGLAPIFAVRDRDECVSELVRAGVPAAALADPRALRDHPQLGARGFYESLEHPVVGRHPFSTLPYRFAGVKQWLRRPAPTLGEHNREVFAELGRSVEEIDALEAAGVIGRLPKGV